MACGKQRRVSTETSRGLKIDVLEVPFLPHSFQSTLLCLQGTTSLFQKETVSERTHPLGEKNTQKHHQYGYSVNRCTFTDDRRHHRILGHVWQPAILPWPQKMGVSCPLPSLFLQPLPSHYIQTRELSLLLGFRLLLTSSPWLPNPFGFHLTLISPITSVTALIQLQHESVRFFMP